MAFTARCILVLSPFLSGSYPDYHLWFHWHMDESYNGWHRSMHRIIQHLLHLPLIVRHWASCSLILSRQHKIRWGYMHSTRPGSAMHCRCCSDCGILGLKIRQIISPGYDNKTEGFGVDRPCRALYKFNPSLSLYASFRGHSNNS